MARSSGSALFRAHLYPLRETWTPGPGRSESVIRFVLPASGMTSVPGEFRSAPALIAPEIPVSILPRVFCEGAGIEVAETSEHWRARPAPMWRGVPCRYVTFTLRTLDLVTGETQTFTVLALLPDRDPPGPRPAYLLLGAEFFQHYAFRLMISYAALRYLAPDSSSRRGIDTSIPCGYLEKP